MIFGIRLKKLREDKELTQEQLAKNLNVSRSNISKYEKSQLEPNLEFINKVCEFFNVTSDYMLGHTDKKEIKIVKYDINGYETAVAMAKSKNITQEELIQLMNILKK